MRRRDGEENKLYACGEARIILKTGVGGGDSGTSENKTSRSVDRMAFGLRRAWRSMQRKTLRTPIGAQHAQHALKE